MDISTGWLESHIHAWIYPWISISTASLVKGDGEKEGQGRKGKRREGRVREAKPPSLPQFIFLAAPLYSFADLGDQVVHLCILMWANLVSFSSGFAELN